jgi:tRNA nucleotidyltransferase (CCA-adding enzyme)
MDLKPFLDLAALFHQHGFQLWMVGGTSRDYLLGLPLKEFDLTTDATPSDMATFLPQASFRFAHYGTVQWQHLGYPLDITTLRQESIYQDKRHPKSITFVKDLTLDYVRRDLTINALYIDVTLRIHDFTTGQLDLKAKLLRMIGEPVLRFQEDPLRILRVIRFQHHLGFEPTPDLAKALNQSLSLLDYLNPDKVRQEIQKMMMDRPYEASLLLASYGIDPDQR